MYKNAKDRVENGTYFSFSARVSDLIEISHRESILVPGTQVLDIATTVIRCPMDGCRQKHPAIEPMRTFARCPSCSVWYGIYSGYVYYTNWIPGQPLNRRMLGA